MKLPKLPPTPKRPLPAPTRESATITVERVEFRDTEPPTGHSSREMQTYQSLLSVFDSLTPEDRLEFVGTGRL